MRNRKQLALLLAAAIFSITACTTTNNQQEQSAASDGSGTADVAEEMGFGEKDPESYSADLTLMVHSTGQPEYMIEKFNEIYPNIHIELIVVPSAEQQERIMTMVNSNEDVADMFTSRTQFVKAMVNSDQYYMDLSAEPFNAGEWTDQIEDYVVGVGTDTNGALRALSWQCPVGGIFYRRSMAKEYFGTDDPEEISELFSSYDSMLDAARTVKEKSNGEVYFMADAAQDLNFLTTTAAGGYLIDNTLNTNEAIVDYMELTKTMYDEGLCAKLFKDDTTSQAMMAEDKIFAVAKPTWGLNYNIMPAVPEQSGDWALASGPAPYTAGGTYIGISATTEHPEECYLFLKFIMTNEEFVYDYATEFGDYVSNKAIQEKVGSMNEEEAADLDLDIFRFLNGQNAYAYWNAELEKGVDSSTFTPYDEAFQNYLQSTTHAYASGTITLEEALEQYKSDCKNFAPSIEVE